MPHPDLRILWSAGCAAPPSVYACTGRWNISVDDSSMSSGLPTSTACGRPRSHKCALCGVISLVISSCRLSSFWALDLMHSWSFRQPL
eukprot:9729737-Heterocapsa_arctica.AAC.1